MEDKISAIVEVQRYLHAAAESDERIPTSPIDGVYGNETRAAVKEFQRINGLCENGTADEETFRLLAFSASERETALAASHASAVDEEIPLRCGSHGASVRDLHTSLRSLSRYYELGDIPVGDFFVGETRDAVRTMQNIFRIEESGTADELLLLRLRREVIARKKFSG